MISEDLSSKAPSLCSKQEGSLSVFRELDGTAQGRSPSTSLVSVNRVIQTSGRRVVSRKGVHLEAKVGKGVHKTPLFLGTRRRSSWFYLARSRFSRVLDLGVLDLKELGALKTYFDQWREGYRKKYVHLEREDQTHIFIKQYSRFDEDYRQFLRRKLRILNVMLWDLKIELTVDPKRFMRLADEFYFINKAWNRLRSWLYRRFGEFEYFKVLEITHKGRPHFHVLISGIKWVDQKKLSDLWSSYGAGEIVYIKRVFGRNKLKMCAYVMKYVNKTLRKSDKVFSALLFASNRRLFSMSKGCQHIINAGKLPKTRKGFRFEGSVHEKDLIEFCEERYVELEAFMIVKASFEDYREFPSVFPCYNGEGG